MRSAISLEYLSFWNIIYIHVLDGRFSKIKSNFMTTANIILIIIIRLQQYNLGTGLAIAQLEFL